MKKQAEEAASKGENEQAEVTITLQEQSQEEPQQHLPQETVEEEEHFADRLPNVKNTEQALIWRLAFILTCLGTAILVALYFVSPLSRLSEVTVSGNKSVESQAIIQQSKLETGSGLWEQYSKKLFFCKYSEKVSNYKKANIKLNGINSFKIDIQEYQIVALAATKGGYHPILEMVKLWRKPPKLLKVANQF